MNTKICSKCKIEQPLDNFNNSKRDKDGKKIPVKPVIIIGLKKIERNGHKKKKIVIEKNIIKNILKIIEIELMKKIKKFLNKCTMILA
jgi:hypothetical protein